MWNDTELQHDIENEVGWELNAGLTQISVTVRSRVELPGAGDDRNSDGPVAWISPYPKSRVI